MGIFIHLGISRAVQKKEWEKVYEETLQLVDAFPLAERRNVKCRGVDTICLVPTRERKHRYGWNNEKTRVGWCAVGDYETMHTAEEYFLSRDMIEEKDYEADAGDALLGLLPGYLDYDEGDSRFGHTYKIWGGKTQGEPYHIYILAIACLIESRLGNKAFVYGDITRAQCERAVELANMHLSEPINIPARCDMDCLRKRVSELPFAEREQLEIFESFFLGTKNSEFGQYIRTMYSEKACDEYWEKQFKNAVIGTFGFTDEIKKYLLWGFSLEKLCEFVNYNDEENISQYNKFVKGIMETKLHLKEKDCEDILEIDQNEEQPYSIYTLMAQFAFAGAKNRKVDRYIPIEEIRIVLKKGLAGKCDVDKIIDEYLAKEAELQAVKGLKNKMSEQQIEAYCEQDASEIFSEAMDIRHEILMDERKKYDILDYEDLIYYERGDTVHPRLADALQKSFSFYNNLTTEKYYMGLMEKPAIERCEWLIQKNRSILIRDKDWEKIFSDIEENEEAFARYYPMVRVRIDSEDLVYLIWAIVLNDELYSFCGEMAANELMLRNDKK